MTSYDKLTPDSEPLPNHSPTTETLAEDNVILVRKGLTPKPQNSRADFNIRSTGYSLEIRFSQRRLRACPLFTNQNNDADEPTFSLVLAAATILLVGGSVALTQSIVFGVFIAIAIPIFWKLSLPSKGPTQRRIATLRFVNTPQNQTFLSLTTAPNLRTTARHRAQHSANAPSKRKRNHATLHFSNLPVRLVSASTHLMGAQLSLTLYTSDAHGQNKLRITGTREEIRWLHSRIAQWAKETLPHSLT